MVGFELWTVSVGYEVKQQVTYLGPGSDCLGRGAYRPLPFVACEAEGAALAEKRPIGPFAGSVRGAGRTFSSSVLRGVDSSPGACSWEIFTLPDDTSSLRILAGRSVANPSAALGRTLAMTDEESGVELLSICMGGIQASVGRLEHMQKDKVVVEAYLQGRPRYPTSWVHGLESGLNLDRVAPCWRSDTGAS